MKKKMTVLCALLALVGITSYSVSGTYAKYVGDFSFTDSARVAVWGFENDKEIEINLFAASYTTTVAGQDNAVDVESANGTDKVVAPGTSGIYTFTLGENKPETNYELTVSDNSSVDEITTKGNGQMKYYLRDVTGQTLTGATFQSLAFTDAEKYNDINALINGIGSELNGVYAANTAPNHTYVIGWEWVIDGDDAEDTNLGNGIAKDGSTGAQANVTLSVKIDVVQSEKKPTK